MAKNDTGTSVVFWRGRYLAYVRHQESCPPDWPLVRAVGLSESEAMASCDATFKQGTTLMTLQF